MGQSQWLTSSQPQPSSVSVILSSSRAKALMFALYLSFPRSEGFLFCSLAISFAFPYLPRSPISLWSWDLGLNQFPFLAHSRGSCVVTSQLSPAPLSFKIWNVPAEDLLSKQRRQSHVLERLHFLTKSSLWVVCRWSDVAADWQLWLCFNPAQLQHRCSFWPALMQKILMFLLCLALTVVAAEIYL